MLKKKRFIAHNNRGSHKLYARSYRDSELLEDNVSMGLAGS